MTYCLRKEEKGLYSQMYESYWDINKKQLHYKNVMAFGYMHNLISYYKEFTKQKNPEHSSVLTKEPIPALLPPL